MLEESRGYQTNYKPKPFFYLVVYGENGLCKAIFPMTKDARRHTIQDWWKSIGIRYIIHSQELFDKWTK